MYFVVWISSVNGARKATCFVVENMGSDCENGNLWLLLRKIGPLLKMELMLDGILYGGSIGSDSTVEMDVADTADDEVKSDDSAELDRSARMCVGVLEATAGTSVVSGVNAGLCGLVDGDAIDCRALYPLRNVFLDVGEVEDNVSRRKLVDDLPKVEGRTAPVVFSVSFGRLEGEGEGEGMGGDKCGSDAGPYVIGEEARMVSDMVLEHMDGGGVRRGSSGSGDRASKASMISTL